MPTINAHSILGSSNFQSMKKSSKPNPEISLEKKDALTAFKEKLDLQNSAIKKLTELFTKTRTLSVLLFSVAINAFAQTATMTWVDGEKTKNSTGSFINKGVGPYDIAPGGRADAATVYDADGNLWLFGGRGYDKTNTINGYSNYLNDLWMWDGSTWIWLSGSESDNATGVYGTMGTAASANTPGARYKACAWIDGSGNFWLFGGFGHGNSNGTGYLNDLWKWDGTDWTWISGGSLNNLSGHYGGSNQIPGSRYGQTSWTDDSGNLWLFGGRGYGKFDLFTTYQGYLSDLWKWDGSKWTWIKGSWIDDQSGIYNTKGTTTSSSKPGSRAHATSFIDASGNFWLYGGYGKAANSNTGYLNDLWKWDGSDWTWHSGSDSVNLEGRYGNGNAKKWMAPGGRSAPMSGVNASGEFLIYGGYGKSTSSSTGPLADLWSWDGTKWKYLKGSTTIGSGGYRDIKGYAHSFFYPRARYGGASWLDKDGAFWVLGGYARIPNASNSSDRVNDLWKWENEMWTWVKGDYEFGINGIYGNKGGNNTGMPSARKNAANGKSTTAMWLYGGLGYDKNGDQGYLSDLWMKDDENGSWTWVNGSDLKDVAATNGTKGTANASNTPGKREGALLWANGSNVWLFGGSYESGGTTYYLNDLWKWDGTNWTWISGSSSANASGVYTGSNQVPGGRIGNASWIDNSGYLWLFGGLGYDKNGDVGRLNDLWFYAGGNWYYSKGDDVKNASSVHGTKGTSSTASKPGARAGSSYWKGPDGKFWLFGGDGYDENGDYGSFNDVWKLDGITWTWMYGEKTRNSSGNYGTQYVEASTNVPGARKASTAWQDDNGFTWVFGGYGKDDNGITGRLNDLWVHNKNNWIWVSGSKTKDANAVYNNKNTTNASSIIGARSAAVTFMANNEVFVFGGASRDENGNTGSFNDGWKIETAGYAIENGKLNSIALKELAISATENSDNALQDAGDKVELSEVRASFNESTNNLPANTNIARRYPRNWSIQKTDASANGGVINLGFEMGEYFNKDFSYYLLERTTTGGTYHVVNNVNYKLTGTQVVFSTDLDEITTDDQYAIARSATGPGYALNFDKATSSDYVDLPINQNPNGSDFTVECWFKTDAIGAHQDLIAQHDGTGTGRPYLRIQSNGKLATRLSGSTTEGTTTLVKDKWYHAAIVYDGSTMSLYLNGQPEFLNSSITPQSATGNLILGTNDIGDNPFDGEMDELRIWDDERTIDEITKNIHATLKGDETGLLAYYKFDQTAEAYLPDASANSNQGALKDFAITGSSSNWVQSTCPIVDKEVAKNLTGPGNGLDFDGTNDNVDLGSILDPSAADWSFEAWIKPEDLSNSYHVLLSQKDGTGSGDTYFLFSNGKPRISLGTYKVGSTALSTNKWYHVALCYDQSATTQYLYIDGILEFELNSAISAADGALMLGSNNTGNNPYDGKVDDIRFWSSCRTQTEIQDNMYASLDGDETGLLAYYNCNHASGTTLTDATTNSNDGTLSNFSGTYWVSVADREPFKTIRAGTHSSNNTWKGGTAPSSSTDKLAVFHDLTLSSTGTYSRLQVNSGQSVTTNADITVSGEVIVNGSATGTNKIVLAGSAKQCLGGAGTLNALQVNNNNDVSLEGDLTITGALTLTSGDIEINDHTLTLSGTTTHGSSSSYLKLNGTGSVKTSVGSDPVILPIGRNPYLPIIIDDGGDAEYTVSVADKVYANPVAETTEQTANVVSETWSIQSSAAQTGVSVTLQWEAAEEETGFDRSNSHLSYWENGVSTKWIAGTTLAASGSGPYSVTRSIDFSTNLFYFGVGSNGSALPVELTYFNAEWITSTPINKPLDLDTERSRSDHSRSVLLTWATSIEENNSHFEIERSSDGINWQAIGIVQGQGTTFSPTQYSFTDNKLKAENSGFKKVYYRLKQVDFNGQFEYSDIRTLHSIPETRDFQVYPNPSNGSVIYIDKKDNYRIRTTTGKELIPFSTSTSINVADLQKGVYVIENSEGTTQLYMRN